MFPENPDFIHFFPKLSCKHKAYEEKKKKVLTKQDYTANIHEQNMAHSSNRLT